VVTLSHFSGFAATLEENYLQASFAQDAEASCRNSDQRVIHTAARKSTQANPSSNPCNLCNLWFNSSRAAATAKGVD
jgi:hypothetical protein